MAQPDFSFDANLPRLSNPEELRAEAGDKAFGNGLYRVLSDDRASMIEREVARAYPDFNGLDCFATDWMGNVFAVRKQDQHVVILEPGTAMLLNTRNNFISFQANEITTNPDAALEAAFYAEWRALGHSAPEVDQCVGYIRPLFQGGSDSLDNLELIDMDVYWTVTAPFIARARTAVLAGRQRRS